MLLVILMHVQMGWLYQTLIHNPDVYLLKLYLKCCFLETDRASEAPLACITTGGVQKELHIM